MPRTILYSTFYSESQICKQLFLFMHIALLIWNSTFLLNWCSETDWKRALDTKFQIQKQRIRSAKWFLMCASTSLQKRFEAWRKWFRRLRQSVHWVVVFRAAYVSRGITAPPAPVEPHRLVGAQALPTGPCWCHRPLKRLSWWWQRLYLPLKYHLQ